MIRTICPTATTDFSDEEVVTGMVWSKGGERRWLAMVRGSRHKAA
jgi:hypothetical protein